MSESQMKSMGGGEGRRRGLGSRCWTIMQGETLSIPQFQRWREGSSALGAPLLSLSGDTASPKRHHAAPRELTATRRLCVHRDGQSAAAGRRAGTGRMICGKPPARRGSRAGAAAGAELVQEETAASRRVQLRSCSTGSQSCPPGPGRGTGRQRVQTQGEEHLLGAFKIHPGPWVPASNIVAGVAPVCWCPWGFEALAKQHNSTHHPRINSMGQISGLIPASQDAHVTLCLGSAPCKVPSLHPG